MVISAKLQMNERNACCPCIGVREDDLKKSNKTSKNESSTEAKMEEKGEYQTDEGIGEEVSETGGVNKLNNNIMTSSASFSSDFSISTTQTVENKNTKINSPMCTFFRNFYVDFILDKRTKLAVFIIFIIYLLLSIYGIVTMQQGLDYEKLLIKSDPLMRTMKMEIELFHGGDQIEIAIVRAPNMSLKVERERINKLVEEFESIPYCIGRNGTEFWLREYIKYAEQTGAILVDNDQWSWIRAVYEWSRLFAFYKLCFRIGVTNFNNANDLVLVTQMLREVASRHKDLEVYTFQHGRAIADQLNVLLPFTLRNDLLAMACMVVISLLCIPNPICTVWITLAMFSIEIGVIGFLSFWNVKLDPISMITLILAIGFSIEFSAHVTYGFVSGPANLNPRERCIDTLEKLAWPTSPSGYGSACTQNSQCKYTNSECRKDICYCRIGFNYNGQDCLPQGVYDPRPNAGCAMGQVSINGHCYNYVGYGGFCEYSKQCNYIGSICFQKRCVCPPGQLYNGKQCINDPNIPNVLCPPNHIMLNGQCLQLVGVGERCMYDLQCRTRPGDRPLICRNFACYFIGTTGGIGYPFVWDPSGAQRTFPKCRNPSADVEVIGGIPIDCIYKKCSPGYHCEYNNLYKGGQYVCCGISPENPIYGKKGYNWN
uniref:Patched family protein n=1 Tax=Meloidogyne hapla TaxID=6305 RepID=A0A1I8BMU1_MELHA